MDVSRRQRKHVSGHLKSVDSHIRTTPNNLHRAKIEIWKNCENITYIKFHTFWNDDTLANLAGVYQREVHPESDPIEQNLVDETDTEEEESPSDESRDSPHRRRNHFSSSGPEPMDSVATDTASDDAFSDVFDFARPMRLRTDASDSDDSSPEFERNTSSD